MNNSAQRVAIRHLIAKGRPHLNKEDPGSLLGTLHYLLVDKHGLRDLAPDIKAFSRKINDAWQAHRTTQ